MINAFIQQHKPFTPQAVKNPEAIRYIFVDLFCGAGGTTTGCQLLWIISWRLDIERSILDFNDALLGLSKVSMKITSNLEMYADTMKICENAKNHFYTSLKDEKKQKQKYIRHQHKLAQSHYRRK